MPWHISKRSGKFCVIKDADGSVEKCHTRKAEADAHLSALYASEQDGAKKEERMGEVDGLIDKVVLAIKSFFGEEPTPEPSLTVWKEADGTMRWLGLPTNNYRDDDAVPEILSAAAHQGFVKAFDEGRWPAPELWLWHVPGTRVGVTEVMSYDDDSGCLIAVGTVDAGKEAVVEKCVELGDLMSHGMPVEEIRRDESDPTILTRYRSREFSLLPAKYAANKLTRFETIKENEDMAVPEEKVQELAERGVDTDGLNDKLEEAKAEGEGRERKEVEEEVVETEATEEVTEAAPEVVSIGVEEFGQVVGTAINEALAPLTERLDAIEGTVKAITATQEEQAKELEMTPAASLAQVIKSSVIGQEATQVDGRSKEAKDKPAETKAFESRTGIDLIDGMKAGVDWRQLVGS